MGPSSSQRLILIIFKIRNFSFLLWIIIELIRTDFWKSDIIRIIAGLVDIHQQEKIYLSLPKFFTNYSSLNYQKHETCQRKSCLPNNRNMVVLFFPTIILLDSLSFLSFFFSPFFCRNIKVCNLWWFVVMEKLSLQNGWGIWMKSSTHIFLLLLSFWFLSVPISFLPSIYFCVKAIICNIINCMMCVNQAKKFSNFSPKNV